VVAMQIQVQFSVDSANALVIPVMPLVSQIVGHLLAALAALPLCQLAQHLHDLGLLIALGYVAMYGPIQAHGLARTPFTQFAYIYLRRRFSSSNSFIRFGSLMLISRYLALHLYKKAVLKPCGRIP
jgi:hypothetical protein